MIISLIAALDERGAIGRDGGLPWHLTDDLKHFKRVTMGHHLIMGRKTFEGIGGKLPGRSLIVLSRVEDYIAPGAQVAHSLDEALGIARQAGEGEAFVIGGAQVFEQALPLAQRFYLTRVHAEVKADTYFPDFDEGLWEERDSQHYERVPKNDYSFTIRVLERLPQD